MTSMEDVEQFLKEFKVKMGIWDVLFLSREKNIQTLADLEIPPIYRKQILTELEDVDYCQGPIPDDMMNGADMWIFGKTIKSREVYIKITMGNPNLSVMCISFHLAEHPMNYPLK
jgi:hypothetical protein